MREPLEPTSRRQLEQGFFFWKIILVMFQRIKGSTWCMDDKLDGFCKSEGEK